MAAALLGVRIVLGEAAVGVAAQVVESVEKASGDHVGQSICPAANRMFRQLQRWSKRAAGVPHDRRRPEILSCTLAVALNSHHNLAKLLIALQVAMRIHYLV